MFNELLKKYRAGDEEAFRQMVLWLAGEIYPAEAFSAGKAPGTLRCRDRELGLYNIEARFRLSKQTEEELRVMVRAQFDILFTGQIEQNLGELSWGEAKPIVVAQLMPFRFTQMQVPVVWQPFHGEVVAGVVIDDDKGYRYVRELELKAWNITEEELFQVARDNLVAKTKGVQMQGSAGPDRMLVISTHDGYDAARIQLPELHQFLGNHLGLPFSFGIPNRDFLICWAQDGSREFQAAISGQVGRDFQAQPYPLCGEALQVDAAGKISAAPRPGV